MTKPQRSPVLGYNHNVRYRGRLFHVQTEDSGPVNPRLYTHLFFEGTILSSKKHEYDASIHEDDVKVVMQRLHKTMIRELTHSEHDPRIVAFFAARGQAAFSEPPPARAEAPAPAVEARPAPAESVPPHVVQVSGQPATYGSAPPRPAAPAASAPRPMVVIKPTDLKRPPMVFSQSADGVVVQRSVVIGVGVSGASKPGGAGNPQQPAVRIRPAVPYVVTDGSHAVQSPARPTMVGGVATQPAAPVAHSPQPHAGAGAAAPPRGRTPSPVEKPFSDLVNDKSLDDVILEYLSDDGEPEPR